MQAIADATRSATTLISEPLGQTGLRALGRTSVSLQPARVLADLRRHWSRRATVGSSRAARRAGSQDAMGAIRKKTPATVAKAAGAVAFTRTHSGVIPVVL